MPSSDPDGRGSDCQRQASSSMTGGSQGSHASSQFQNRTNTARVVLSILHNFDSLHDSWAAEKRLEKTPCRDNLRIV
ncbi:hypothetical protein AGABI1DRAFT_111322 [Agaricus bisporus var. burnettii JB137-S8]|uniref:Uncharacterized protein n=1 Tax=Agaricus bisporus var. burnettii (strain JB137-S8 / ATCC MYA-4627 / FGSC 10392) TaxID=597362 RepID=K5XH20_AGABU|nr:hypothetical protein AGABI2DRAFT_190544 [Agaricus bisporus var. bisporus H97]XP_007326672.1 uncharacterized protein AGABI1DRAFT_111322 [Agaricus bisporus var. burnettii JB137-S8]EKM82743.1 hypothetical protein AGABI1DRAFT_111322 [Agaricus bisporus var. burnettii JB137-S8]EKV50143.1 hypothetical protein AGABI2DRAFT_190544 [Agaricus bisporus var. bisporus H97]